MNNSEVISDFRRRWEGTYVWVEMEDLKEECLVRIREVAECSNKIGVLHLESSKYGLLTINLASEGHSIKFKYPPVGVFQFKRDACLFRRRPARQYRRGICADNSTLMNTTRNIVGNHIALNEPSILAAFQHNTFAFDVALLMLAKGAARSVALANNYSLSLSMLKTPDYVLFHWNIPVARVSKEGKVTQVLCESYANLLDSVISEGSLE